MNVHDIAEITRDLRERFEAGAREPSGGGKPSFPKTVLGAFDEGGSVTISRFSGLVPWERHMHGDEYLQVLEGELDIAIIDGDESYEVGLSAGSAFIVPRAAWHKQKPKGAVTLLVVRAVEHGPVSFADDPRET